VPGKYSIKQIGGKMPAGELSYRVDGVPTFEVGETYVVLLAGVSAAGFSSPVGLAQGKFTVRKDAAGSVVSNGRDFREMTAGIEPALLPQAIAKASALPAPVRSMDMDEFKQLVRARAVRAGRPR
jgi:hypothetical protein